VNEATLQRRIRKAAEERGAYLNKTHGGQYSRGIPDLIGCYKRYSLVWEVKMPGRESTVTANQKDHLRRAKAAGAVTAVVTSVTQAMRILDAIDRACTA
jgi:hypothetical protein